MLPCLKWPLSVSVPASEETYAIKDLSPDAYTLWMTASTSVGEGPTGQRSKVKFFIARKSFAGGGRPNPTPPPGTDAPFIVAETPFPTLQVVGLIAIMVLILLVCLCQRSTVKQRSESSSSSRRACLSGGGVLTPASLC